MKSPPLVSVCPALVIAVALSLSGCGEATPKHAKRNAAAPVAAAEAPQSVVPKKDSQPISGEAMANYRPPFVDRDDPFAPPNSELAQRLAKANNVAGDVELKGVIDVDTPRAILRINGKVAHARAGETVQGVKVVRIEGERVTLERGERSWTVLVREHNDQASGPAPHPPTAEPAAGNKLSS